MDKKLSIENLQKLFDPFLEKITLYAVQVPVKKTQEFISKHQEYIFKSKSIKSVRK